MLADHEIATAAKGHGIYLDATDRETRIGIEPYVPAHLNPASYDLTLSPHLRVEIPLAWTWPEHIIDVANVKPGYTQAHEMEAEGYVLPPGAFVLGATNEVVDLPDTLAARVEGKSSLGRLGLAVHITAGFIDPGFTGSITLEIANLMNRPIRLRPGMRIAQIAFTPMHSAPAVSYAQTGHYQFQGAGPNNLARPQESRFKMPKKVRVR